MTTPDRDAPPQGHDIIVIGASSGGVTALVRLASQLPADLPAAVLIVLHVSPEAPSLLPSILRRASPLEVVAAAHHDRIAPGTIYVARPDHHLLIESDRIALSRGPHENRVRPSLDVLFRSAAVSCGARVIGVVLTGLLDDGSAGLAAIKRCGGLAVVQDPSDAEHGGMPGAAIRAANPEHVVPLGQMAPLLARLARTPASASPPVPEDLALEAAVAREIETPDLPRYARLGRRAPLVCPQCGGGLWEISTDEIMRFRCHLGHAFTARSLLSGQRSGLLQTLSTALRMFDERARLLEVLVAKQEDLGRGKETATDAGRAAALRGHYDRIQ